MYTAVNAHVLLAAHFWWGDCEEGGGTYVLVLYFVYGTYYCTHIQRTTLGYSSREVRKMIFFFSPARTPARPLDAQPSCVRNEIQTKDSVHLQLLN